jgi:hypothetical protein
MFSIIDLGTWYTVHDNIIFIFLFSSNYTKPLTVFSLSHSSVRSQEEEISATEEVKIREAKV